jgi:GTP pyrophosphokinase
VSSAATDQSVSANIADLQETDGKPRYLISNFCSDLENYLPPEQIREVYRAYLFGAEAHAGQKRMSGEPYIYHPIAVSRILSELHMDYKCLMAAILHDVIEDTGTAKEKLIELFDEEIADLVDGVSKLTNLDFKSREEMQAANVQKMLLAMTRDIRVILIKLADRLHNMRTLGVMRPDKARRISRETLEIYAPIAGRLGIYTMRVELEKLGFQAYYPWRYRIIEDALRDLRGNRREIVDHIESAICNRLEQEGMKGEVIGREKNISSIYRKMSEKRLKLKDLADVYAFRIIVDDVDTCYRILGVVHNLYKPVPGKFKDYIAIPKANGYQSLHTVLFGPHGLPIEVQIRSSDMDRIAESGIAAHWLYKLDGRHDEEASNAAAGWLNNLLELQKGAGNSEEFLEHVKVDLFPDEVYVFTPRGKILKLPKGATVIDFAYAVHSDVGNHCVAARVDRRLVPLRSRLFNGQTVEILTSSNARPSPAWLDVVITGKARANIRSFLKQLKNREAIELGKRILEKELEIYDASIEDIPAETRESYLKNFGLPNFDAVYEDIALGNRMALMVARHMMGNDADILLDDNERKNRPLAIRGTEGLVVKYAKCCRPIPGDPIGAMFRPGTGIVVHHRDCKNLSKSNKQGDSWLDVQWEEEMQGEFSTEIRVEVGNQRGVLAEVASTISDTDSNIEHVHTEERDGVTTALTFVITTHDRQHLAKIMKRLKTLSPVIRIIRQMA